MARLSILNKLLLIEGTKYGLKKNLKKFLFLCIYFLSLSNNNNKQLEK